MVTDRTNILLITSDQQHWNTLGINNPEIQTPNLDRLANSGTTFNRTYCPIQPALQLEPQLLPVNIPASMEPTL
jgi:hypothetical protein